jgi:type I restriction enzyme, S subunit
MSRWEIPNGWEWAKVRDIADVIGGGTPPSKDLRNFSTNGIPWLTPADLTGYRDAYIEHGARDLSELGLSKSSARVLPKGTVLFTSRAPIGYCAIASQPLATNQGFKSLVLPDGVSPEFLRHYLLASKDYAESLSSGTTFRELSATRMKELEIPLAPPAEQQRIVAKIEALQERSRRAREALLEVGPLLEQFRQSVLAAAFRGNLTADWRAAHPNIEPVSELLHRIRTERRCRWEQAELAKYEAKGTKPPENWKDRYKEPEPLDDSALPKLPDRWEWIRVMEIGEVRLGRQRSPKYHAGPNMRPYLRVMNVFEDRIATEDVMEMDFSPEDYERYRLEPGDILLNEGQSHELVGRSAIYCGEIPGACFTNTLVRFRPDTPLGSDYPQIVFLGYLKSGRFQRLASLTVNIAHLGAGRFAEMEFPLPPLEEQEEIVKRARGALDQIAWLEKRLRANFADLNQLDQAILAKAFRGDLVPQDPNDEPASILLERIRKQRAQQAEAAKARKKTAKTQPRNGTIKKSSYLASQQQPKADAQASTGQTIASEQLWFKY